VPAADAPPPRRSRRPSRPIGRALGSLAVAAAVAFAGGLGLGVGLGDGDDATEPSSQGSPAGEDPEGTVAGVARALLPSVVHLQTERGLGSGVVFRADGSILTAAHVVEGASELTVRLSDGRRVPGRIVGVDTATDVALVKASSGGLTPAPFAVGTRPAVGDLAVAIGSPFGLEATVTAGVVSAVGRAVPVGGSAMPMVQTDAPINPGNSGGALADDQGRVIGINDSIRTATGQNAGVGFAIPIDVAVRVAKALDAGKTPRSGFLGVTGTTPKIGLGGALVTDVTDGSPGDRAGIRKGDLITSFDGLAVATIEQLTAFVRTTAPRTEIELEVRRDGSTDVVRVTISRAGTR
jgi:S1-C subfamily serine protease